MKNGLYKIVGYDEKGKELCEYNSMEIGDEVEITKIEAMFECAVCGRKEKYMYQLTCFNEYNLECEVGSTCIKHLKLSLIQASK